MKRILRHYVFDTFSLWAIAQMAQGIVFGKGTQTILIAGIGVTLISIFAKPIINILLLPINMITFGLFRFISSAIILYLATLVVPEFKVEKFFFPGIKNPWIDIPEISLTGIISFIGFGFLFSLVASFIYWIRK